MNELRCIGNDRTFDKIVKQSIARENEEANRQSKLVEYMAQAQRGTIRTNAHSNVKVEYPNTKTSGGVMNSHRSAA